VLAERVDETLSGLRWRMWLTSRHTLLYVSPDELCGVVWILANDPFELGGLPLALQLSARSHAASGRSEWKAYFTLGVHPAPTSPAAQVVLRVVVTGRCPNLRAGPWTTAFSRMR
jgi:hypothetical protein